jgi:hypothetical protein
MGETRHWQVEIQSPSLTRTEIGLEQYSCLATPPLLFGSVVFGVQHGLTICLNIVTNGSTWNWWPLHVRPLARKHVRTQCASYPHDLIYCTCVLFPGPQLNTLWFCSEIHNKKKTPTYTQITVQQERPQFFPSYAVVLAAEDIGYSQADLVERANRLLPSWGVDISDCPFRKIHWGARQLWLAGKNMAQDKLFKLHQLSSAVANQTEIWTRIKWHSFEMFWANDTILLCICNVVNHAKPNHQSPIEQCYTTQYVNMYWELQ